MQETQVHSLGGEGPLEEGMASHSSMLAWRIPWIEEPGGVTYSPLGSERVRQLKQLSTQTCQLHAWHRTRWPVTERMNGLGFVRWWYGNKEQSVCNSLIYVGHTAVVAWDIKREHLWIWVLIKSLTHRGQDTAQQPPETATCLVNSNESTLVEDRPSLATRKQGPKIRAKWLKTSETLGSWDR